MANAHDEGKAAASAAVLEQWRKLAKAAREAGMHGLADQADKAAAAREALLTKGTP